MAAARLRLAERSRRGEIGIRYCNTPQNGLHPARGEVSLLAQKHLVAIAERMLQLMYHATIVRTRLAKGPERFDDRRNLRVSLRKTWRAMA